MTLEDKIENIQNPKIQDGIGLLPNDCNKSMEDFFEKFIKPRLPKQEYIKRWHRLLMDYIKDWENVSCAVRFGNRGDKSESLSGESGYLKLRRGWLTKDNNSDFDYFYADNYMSSFFYKMALDGFVPKLDEFKKMFYEHKFPYGFGFHVDKKYESERCIIPTAKEPGFLGKYKISHIFDSGKNYKVGAETYDITKLSENYFDIGRREEWNNSDSIRRMDIDDNTKKIIIASFLRFVHPINHFLTPSKKRHKCSCWKDVGEYPKLIEYMKNYIKKTYPKEYKEYIDTIMWNFDDDSNECQEEENNFEVSYGPSNNFKYTEKEEKQIVSYYLLNKCAQKYLGTKALYKEVSTYEIQCILKKYGISGKDKGTMNESEVKTFLNSKSTLS